MACANSVVAAGVNLTVGGSSINLAVSNPSGCVKITPGAGATVSPSVPGIVALTPGTNGWVVAPEAAGTTVLTFGAPGFTSTPVNVSVAAPAVDVVSF
jgi:hypothetical protein